MKPDQSWWKGAFVWLVAMLGLFGAGSTRVLADRTVDGLAACLGQISTDARALGARAIRRHPARFMLAPESSEVDIAMPEDGCLGVLAVGRRQVQQIELTVYSAAGEALGQAASAGAYGYVRVCGPAGMRLVAHIVVHSGAGEVEVMSLFGAPEKLPSLASAMTSCIGIGQPQAAPVDIGPEPIGAPLGQRLKLAQARLEAMGYRSQGFPSFGALGSYRREQRELAMPQDTCLAIVAVPDADMGDLDFRIFSSSEPPVLLGRAAARGGAAVVRVCTDAPSDYLLDLRSFSRGGRYAVVSMVIRDPEGFVRPVGLRSSTRSALWEVAHRFGSVGMKVQELQWADLSGAFEYRAPLPLSAGRCYGVAAIAGTGIKLDSVSLSVTDASGRMVSSDTGGRPQKMVFLCPEMDGNYAAHVMAPAGLGRTRALLIVAAGADLATDSNTNPARSMGAGRSSSRKR